MHFCCVARGFDLLQTFNLTIAHTHVVDGQDFDGVFFGELVFVHAHDDVFARVDARLLFSGSSFDLELGPAAVYGFGHAAHGFDLFDDGPSFVGHLLSQ